MFKHSFFDVVSYYQANKSRLHATLRGDTVEGLSDTDAGAFMGMTAGVFVVFFLIYFGVWIWALVVLIKYWAVLPVWAQILGVVGLLMPPGPLLTLIVVYVGKGQKKSRFRR